MSKEKKKVILNEGSVKKGGLGNKPSTPRPQPPQAQKVSIETKKSS